MPQVGRKRRLVVFDIDGILCDFALHFSTYSARFFRVKPFFTSEQTRFKGILDQLSREEVDRVWAAVDRDPTFWSTVPCILSQYDKRAMHMLSEEGVEFVYLTNRWDGNRMREQTTDWLYANDIPRGTIVPQRDKAGWVAEAIANTDFEVVGVIEDAPHNITAYRKRGVAVTVRDWPFNRDVEPDAPRVSSVVEFCNEILNRIEAEDG